VSSAAATLFAENAEKRKMKAGNHWNIEGKSMENTTGKQRALAPLEF
jgi:hypothetical protein